MGRGDQNPLEMGAEVGLFYLVLGGRNKFEGLWGLHKDGKFLIHKGTVRNNT